MSVVSRISASITLKLVLAFLAVLTLSLLALFLALRALSETREAQYQLTRDALPLLSTSQSFSRVVNEHLLMLSRVAMSSADIDSLGVQILDNRQALTVKFEELQQLAANAETMLPIERSLSEIVDSTARLHDLVFIQRPRHQSAAEAGYDDIRRLSNKMRVGITRLTIAAQVKREGTTRAISGLEKNLIDIDQVMSRYNQRAEADSISAFSSRYLSALRQMTQYLLQIESPDTRSQLAEVASLLFEHAVSESGFFASAKELSAQHAQIAHVLEDNRGLEQSINRDLGLLLNETSVQASARLTEFDQSLDRSLLVVFVVMLLMTLGSGAGIGLFIVPKVTQRLERLARATNAIAAKNYDTPIDTSGSDEIARMAGALDVFKRALIGRDKANEIIKEREVRLRNIIDNSVDGLITTDEDGAIESFNPACVRLFGYSADEIIGADFSRLMTGFDQPCAGNSLQQYIETHSQGCSGPGQELLGMRKNGETFAMELSLTELELDGARHYSGIVRDVSLRKKTEQERERLISELTSSNEELGRFAFVCSHDLQEPLRMIQSFSMKLESHLGESFEDDEKSKRYFHYITDAARRSQEMIADILAYSSIGNTMGNIELVNIEALVETIVNSLQSNLTEYQGRVTFDNLPNIRGNKSQVFQLFQNLINNGLKYRRDDCAPHVHIQGEELESCWKFSVADNGIGIAEKHLTKIFDVFKRLHRRSKYAGTGIGLSICKKVIERHGGRIWVESTVNAGSTFYFTISKHDFMEVHDGDER